ncbi:MAG: flagellin [Desulfobulbaceae bacterium]|nr:flagellin [Desulfobulbaceae bacterium]
MRITMQTINNNILNNLEKTTNALAKINNQIATGRQMSKLSDDPVNLAVTLSLRTTLSTVVQYQENLSYGKGKISAAETSLQEIKNQMIRAKTLALQAANDTLTPDNRVLIAAEVQNLFEHSILIGNSELNGKYLFGGFRTSGYTADEPAPFSENRYDGYRLNGNALPAVPPAPAPVPLAADDLKVNGIAIGAAVADGNSTAFADSSAEAIAKVVNDISSQSGVTANIIPATATATGPVTGGVFPAFTPIVANDLIINGQDIFPGGGAISDNDSNSNLLQAINSWSANTGVVATNNNGTISLTAVDGRNIEVTTTANGEALTNLTGIAGGANVVNFGAIQLKSDEKFQLKTADGTDTALAAIGVDGGAANTGEPDDVGGDGEIWVRAVALRDGAVRYNGDRDHDIEVKISKGSTLAVTKRGNVALSETNVFSGLKRLEDALRGLNYTEVTSSGRVSGPGNTLASGTTGIDASGVVTGSFEVTISDHDYYPAQDTTYAIPVDPALDTPETIRQKLNGIPGLNATWNADNHLEIKTDDPDRYTVAIDNDTSNFTDAIGIDKSIMQSHAIQLSIGEMDTVMDSLTNQISDFGARQNRIEIQAKILGDVELSSTEALSERQDTDITEAIMRLKAKEFAYQSALTAAAKTMQLSLVNFI